MVGKLKNTIISVFLVVITLLNFVFISPARVKYVSEVNAWAKLMETEQTVSIPETNYKINVLTEKLKEDFEKREEIVKISGEFANNNAIIENLNNEGLTEEELEILNLIYAYIKCELAEYEFDIFFGEIYDIENDIVYNGLIYTDYLTYMDNYVMAGCFIISNDYDIPKDLELIGFNFDETDKNNYIVSDNILELNNNHFIFNNKYVKYKVKDCFNIDYEIEENNNVNYDYSLGKLFSYDDMKYVYDNDFTYTDIEVVSMFEFVDYDQLQNTLTVINEEQNRNGYYVQELTITIIDSKLIEEWASLDYPETLFGYSLENLNNTFGKNTTLEFTQDGVKQAELIPGPVKTNWWKSALMIGIGVAAILIGAAIAPLTGGCSFVASLACICKLTAIGLVTDLLVQTAISTISNCIQGQGFWNALGNAVGSTFTVENVAKSFMMSAIMSAVMVGSGLVKACFIEGTQVSTVNGFTSIEDVKVGDLVYSFDEATKNIALMPVTNVMVSETKDICNIALDNGEMITSTALHPWYVQDQGWVPAFSLVNGDELLTESGESVKILGVNRQTLNNSVKVYNLTVNETEDDSYHTYFVGESDVLVHNACKASVNEKPKQDHHYLTNKSKRYTPQIENITKKYNLDLNGRWNIESLTHQGRHAAEYHNYMLSKLNYIDDVANGSQKIFLKMFEGVKETIRTNPEALYKAFWKCGGVLF